MFIKCSALPLYAVAKHYLSLTFDLFRKHWNYKIHQGFLEKLFSLYFSVARNSIAKYIFKGSVPIECKNIATWYSFEIPYAKFAHVPQ